MKCRNTACLFLRNHLEVISLNDAMRRAAVFLLLTGLLANGQEPLWDNSYDQPVDFNCPAGQTISYIKSEHHNHYEDRLWEFGCKNTFGSGTECFMSPYVNNFDQTFTYTCPTNSIVAGISSYHSDHHEDRRWQFYCCRKKGYCTSNCQWTTYVNWFDEAFQWTTPSSHYLVGAESFHDNKYEDRRWKYKYCTKVQC
ncbi:hypothetical protein G5714_005064 [Onychostoma macrolepis]|uniref:Dermatopontin n=1 Tax=Onychostoma macrolepis TaxID=369639 RepID=A0A7J6D6G7_9TELE|nr:hypothetical protein G5714_005064 [Onychostoma macrolepis]